MIESVSNKESEKLGEKRTIEILVKDRLTVSTTLFIVVVISKKVFFLGFNFHFLRI
jgi:hypothetical protein